MDSFVVFRSRVYKEMHYIICRIYFRKCVALTIRTLYYNDIIMADIFFRRDYGHE